MKIVSPLEFKQAFQTVARRTEQEMLRCWPDGAHYTALMRSQVLPGMAQELGLEGYCEKDYYWLDAIFYEEKDTIHFQSGETYAKYIAVALEIENQLAKTAIEVNKLQIFNTPLKVLITYASAVQAETFLAKYARIMADADIFSDFTTKRKQLVIFGPPGSRPPLRLDWTFHVYENGIFTSL